MYVYQRIKNYFFLKKIPDQQENLKRFTLELYFKSKFKNFYCQVDLLLQQISFSLFFILSCCLKKEKNATFSRCLQYNKTLEIPKKNSSVIHMLTTASFLSKNKIITILDLNGQNQLVSKKKCQVWHLFRIRCNSVVSH